MSTVNNELKEGFNLQLTLFNVKDNSILVEKQKRHSNFGTSPIKVEEYRNDFYRFFIRHYEGYCLYSVELVPYNELPSYDIKLPQIYTHNDDATDTLQELKIGTTSYGAMTIKEISNVMVGLYIASETAREICRIINVDPSKFELPELR